MIKNGGHRVNASQPAAFNAAVLDFLNKRARETEPNVKPAPAPTTILKHATALYTSLAFYAGLELDIFSLMDLHPMTPVEAAEALNTKPAFIERLRYALAACDLIEVKDGVFSNTAESSRYLVKKKPDYLGEHVLVNSNLMKYMISGELKTPESVRKGKAAETYDYSKTSYETWLQIFRGTMPAAVKAGRPRQRRRHHCRREIPNVITEDRYHDQVTAKNVKGMLEKYHGANR